jgi:CRISPR-associated protein (TIGR03985 family)
MFDLPPSVEVLTALARGSLRQDLPRAVRSWVILQSVYGAIELGLATQFTYNQWRDRFFTQVEIHHPRDRVPMLHEPTCRCAVSLKDWLFDAEMGVEEQAWSEAFLQLYQLSPLELKQLLETGFSGNQETKSITGRKRLPEGRLFAVTGKQLQNDFADLAKAGWLTAGKANLYTKVTQFPTAISMTPKVDVRDYVGSAIATDAADLFEHLGRPIRGIQRLFLDLEYIVPGQLSEQVAIFQQQLKQVWQQHPVLPIAITYRSARRYGEVNPYVCYPVCVRYFQRAPYLYAYGENPYSEDRLDWYDFRLDRIEALQILDWQDQQVSEALRDRALHQAPPNPEQVQQLLSEVWGFDIYRPSELLLIRFNPYFHAHYIANTERETLLAAVKPGVAERIVRAADLLPMQQASLLKIVQEKPKDVYCRVSYRDGDRNVVMRLRAWGANVEVLLPWSLRSQMARDAQDVWKLYRSMEDL